MKRFKNRLAAAKRKRIMKIFFAATEIRHVFYMI